MKIAIAIPHTGSIRMKTMFSIVKTIRNLKHEWRLLEKEGSIIHWNRESLVKRAIEEECTHVLFVDTDMVFNADAVERLLARDKDIIGAACHLRSLPLTSTIKIHAENGEIINEEKDGLLKCAGVGTGFLLIKTSVFEKLKHPWFLFESDEEGELITGEDMYFCREARKAGFEIYADTTVLVGHIGEMIY